MTFLLLLAGGDDEEEGGALAFEEDLVALRGRC